MEIPKLIDRNDYFARLLWNFPTGPAPSTETSLSAEELFILRYMFADVREEAGGEKHQ